MSHAIDQAEELRKRAIEILLTERAAIDERLAMLSHDLEGSSSCRSSQTSSLRTLWKCRPQCAALPEEWFR